MIVLQVCQIVLQADHVIAGILLAVAQPGQHSGAVTAGDLLGIMVAHGRLDVFADCLHPLEHQIHDAARLISIFTISRDGQQTGIVVHRNTDKFTHIAFFHAELVRNGDDGLMAGQQAVVSTEDGAGVVRVLVIHTGHDFIIGGDIEAGLRGIDIVRVELLAHRLVDILLCIVDVELRTHLIRLVLVQLLLIAGDIRVVLRLGLTVLDHVLFVLLLCAGAGTSSPLAMASSMARRSSIPFITPKPPNSTAQITAAAAICLYLWATAKNSETRSISCS